MSAQLQCEGKLDESVQTAEALTVAAYDQAIRAGLAPDQARNTSGNSAATYGDVLAWARSPSASGRC
jgi:hypothetical protein